MSALILMAVLAGSPECPIIRISAGGEELVIRKMNPLLTVTIQFNPPADSHDAVIPWGDLFVEFQVPTAPHVTRALKEYNRARRVAMADQIASRRKAVEADDDISEEDRKTVLACLENALKKSEASEASEAGGEGRYADPIPVRVTKDGDKWKVLPMTSDSPVIAEAFVTAPSP